MRTALKYQRSQNLVLNFYLVYLVKEEVIAMRHKQQYCVTGLICLMLTDEISSVLQAQTLSQCPGLCSLSKIEKKNEISKISLALKFQIDT